MTPQSAAERLDALTALREASAPTFKTLGEGCYRLLVPSLKTTFEVDFLRRDGGQLKGEVLVRCELAGSRATDGVLTISDVNLSSTRTRASFAKDLEELARTKGADWRALVEEFALRILAAERQGEPGCWLGDVDAPVSDRLLYVDGFPLLADHPLVLFGDGGTGKSILALHFAGSLALQGKRVGLFDWELDASEHRLRLGRLFPRPFPRVRYVRCTRPLSREVDRLRRIVKESDLDFIVFDSVGYACAGPPESAEAALGYFQALRALGPMGSLHIAHVRSGVEGGSDTKPYGSVFFNNSARSCWNIKSAGREAGDGRLQVALHHRKFNTSGRMKALGFEISFAAGGIDVSPLDLFQSPELAADLPLRERVRLALKSGVTTRDELKAELGNVKDDSLRQALSREKRAGRVLEFPDGRLALAVPDEPDLPF